MQGVTKRSERAGDVGLAERDEPRARPGTVVLRTGAAGICGTDLHIFRNEYASTPPVTLGHEVCGHVEELGEGVDPSLMGRRFVAETFFSTCRACMFCRAGRPNLCASRRSIGSHVDGAMAPRVEVPVINLHAPPESISDAAASLAEPLACVTNSLYDRTQYIEAGDEVLVIGPGAIGQLAAQVARVQGGRVTLRGTESDARRLAVAAGLGFAVSTVGDDLEHGRFDVVVECSGASAGYADALRFARKAGHVAQMGLSGHDATLPTDLVCFKELTITSGFASIPRSWQRAMRLMHAGALELETLITATVPLSDWRERFDRSFDAAGIKYVIDPRS